MAKQLNVNLSFTADTSQAKNQLMDLQNQLTKIINSPKSFTGKSFISKEISDASRSAAELKVHLQNATNIKTGSLDFTKLNQSIKKSGKTLNDYGQILRKIGPAGEQAFMTLTKSVAVAEVPIRRSNVLLTEMWTTLKNTARWQISSSILHGFMGTLSSAYRYSQDLNESLNKIRIVTGKNTEEMAEFADKANKAASALSTTTTRYTDASLIYYQQGLSDEEIEARTAVTIKMANAAGENAQIVSDQLTAIWNNFYDGSKSLEYYADVMTALGAATASSTDEIAQGLEKFAAVSNTIGLSYEYATSALATVTAETRQSADIVGTAFKTIFARIQGLKLGESLEDGTDLNKYSEALEKVGISIVDQSGHLKDMDTILSEMGEKWGTLGKNQQVALAQTVAGVRQYNQLISLMDNWDIFEQNLATAEDATGTLQEQADIYAESWEAARDRVKTALQGIYETLIDDNAFIGILNTIEKIISYFDNLIDSVGGLGGALTTLGAILTRVFSAQFAQSLTNVAYNIRMMTASGREQVRREKSEFIEKSINKLGTKEYDTAESEAQKTSLKEQLTLQQKFIDNSSRMSESEKYLNQILLDRHKTLSDETIELNKQKDLIKEKVSNASQAVRQEAIQNSKEFGGTKDYKSSDVTIRMERLKKALTGQKEINEILDQTSMKSRIAEEDINKLTLAMQKMKPSDSVEKNMQELITQIKTAEQGSEELAEAMDKLRAYTSMWVQKKTSRLENEGQISPEKIEEFKTQYRKYLDISAQGSQVEAERLQAMKDAEDQMDRSQRAQQDWANSMVNSANATLSLISSIRMLKGAIDVLNNPDLSGMEKFATLLGAVLTTIPMLLTSFSMLWPTLKKIGIASVAAGAGVNTLSGALIKLKIALHGPFGIIAGLVAFVSAITLINSWLNKHQSRLKEASKEVEELSEKYNKLNDSLNEFKNTAASYDDAIKALEEMDKDTDEYAKALENANAKAKELVETQGLWGATSMQDGLIIIDPEERDRIEKKKEKEAEEAQAEVYKSKIKENKAKIDSDLIELTREKSFRKTDDVLFTKEEALGAAEALAKAEEIALKEGLKVEEALKNLDDLSPVLKSNISSLINNKEALIKFYDSMTDATAANKYYAEQIIRSNLITEHGEEFEKASLDVNGEIDQARYNQLLSAAAAQKNKLGEDETFNVTKYLEELQKLLGTAEEAGSKYGLDFSNALLNSIISGKGKINFDSILASLNPNTYPELLDDIKKMSPNDLQNFLGLSPEILKQAGFESAKDFKEKFEDGLKDWNLDDYISAVDEKGDSKAKVLGLDIEEFKKYRDLLRETTTDYEKNVEGLNEVALANKRMEKGVKTLAKDWEKYNKIFSETNPSLEDMSAVLPDIENGLQDILNIDDEQFKNLSADFVQNNWSLIQDVINGVEGSIDTLRDKAGEDILLSIGATVDKDGDKSIDQAFAELHNIIAAYDDLAQFKVGVNINDQEFIGTCQRMIDQAGMTAKQAQAYFASMGYNIEFKEETKDVPNEYQYPNVTLDPISKLPVIGTPDVVTIRTVNKVAGTAIKTITPSGSYGGDVNVKSTAPKAARTPKGSSGGSKKTSKKTKDSNKEIERYHQIKKEIESLTNTYNRLNNLKEQTFGEEKLNYIKKEIEQIDKLKKKQEQYLNLIAQNLGKDQGALLKYGATFDSDYNISNWENLMRNQLDKYNNAVKSFNAGKLSEKAFEVIEEEYEKFKEAISTYEDSVNLFNEAIDESARLERERISKELEELTYDIDFNIEIDERSLKRLDSIVDRLGRNLNSMVEVIDELTSQTEIYLNQADRLTAGIDSIRENAASEGRGLTDEERKKIYEYENQLGGIKDSLLSIADQIGDSLLEEFNRLGDEIDANISKFDLYNGMLDHYNNIIKLSGRQTKDSALLMELSAQKTNTAMKKLNASNDKYLAYQKMQKDVAKKLSEAENSGNEQDIQYWKKQYKEMAKAAEDAHNDMLQSWSDTLQAAADEFEQNVEITIQKLKDSITSYGLDELADRYEKRKEENSRYLSDLDKEYELNKLINQLENSIDDTDNLKSKEELNKLLEEANKSQEKNVKMTKYDLELLQKKYDLALAEQALEDAKNAKTSMRLVRNDQGNYDYVYTADQEEVDKAQQNYEDKLYDLKKLSEEHIDELSDLIIQNEQELMEALGSIDRTRFETKEAYEAEVNRITEYYMNRDLFLREQLDKAVIESGHVYGDTLLGQLENTGNFVEGHTKLSGQVKESIDSLVEHWISWKETTTEAMTEVGTSSESFSDDVRQDMSDIEEATDELTEKVDEGTTFMQDYIKDLMDTINTWRNNFIANIDAMIRKYEEYLALMDKPISKPQSKVPAVTPTEPKPSPKPSGGGDGGGKGSGGSTKPGTKPPQQEKPKILYSYSFTGPDGITRYSGWKYKSENEARDTARGIIYRNFGINPNTISIKVDAKQFKTGGYTGVWGPEGKLAMLHEKELVLNKEDTSNILSAVETIRAIGPNTINQIKEFLDNNVLKNNLLTSINFNGLNNKENNSTIEQNVTIQADFPGVSAAAEIEEAFNNLINDAIQYTNINNY